MESQKINAKPEQGSNTLAQEGGKTAKSPAFQLKASPLQQQKGAGTKPTPKKPTTKVIGSGSFTVHDTAGNAHTVTIKDGALLEGTGKTAKTVGSIDGEGSYMVTFNDETTAGSIMAMDPSELSGVSIKTKEGKKEVRSIEINKDKVNEGTLYFDDGVYYVKEGVLYYADGKKKAGTITVIKSLENGDSKTELRYDYLDTSGQQQTGNLLDGDFAKKTRKEGDMEMMPGEGSLIRMGKKKRGGRDRDLWMGLGGKTGQWFEMFKQGKGWEMMGGGKVITKLKELKAAGKLQITDDEIKMFDALSKVESSGFLNVINSWDSDKMSMGFKQFTMAGKLQDVIERAEAAFKQYGIELMRDDKGKKVDKFIKKDPKGNDVNAPWLKGMKSEEDLRNNVWAVRFMEAGLDDDVVVKQTEKAMEYFKTLKKSVDTSKPNASYFDEAVVTTILLELNNNRPAYVSIVIKAVQNRVDKDTTKDKFMEILREEIVDVYIKRNLNGSNGKDDKEAGDKGGRLFDKIKNEF